LATAARWSAQTWRRLEGQQHVSNRDGGSAGGQDRACFHPERACSGNSQAQSLNLTKSQAQSLDVARSGFPCASHRSTVSLSLNFRSIPPTNERGLLYRWHDRDNPHRCGLRDRSCWTDRTKPKNFDPFKLSSAVRPVYWARRQRRPSTELLCTMTSSGSAAHSISQTVRELGNDGAHPQPNSKGTAEKDAKDVVEFLNFLMEGM
jgi:hypothetical protein